MDGLDTERLAPDAAGIARAAAILRAGGLVAFPTETVYGLGGDARSDMAAARIFDAKGRPRFNPLIAHVASVDAARRIARFTPEAERLAAAFWPGPLTLVLPLRQDAGIAPLVTAGLPTVAVRVPAHPLARQLLEAVGGPVAAPSANPSGKLSPTRAEDVIAGLSAADRGGARRRTLPGRASNRPSSVSTARRASSAPAVCRRRSIEDCLGARLLLPEAGAAVTAPGMLASHYAPEAALRLNATEAAPGELLLGFGPVAGDLSLSPSGDLTEAAANLFHHLRALDARGARIAVAPIPDRGLGRAINDRLARAAAPARADGALRPVRRKTTGAARRPRSSEARPPHFCRIRRPEHELLARVAGEPAVPQDLVLELPGTPARVAQREDRRLRPLALGDILEDLERRGHAEAAVDPERRSRDGGSRPNGGRSPARAPPARPACTGSRIDPGPASMPSWSRRSAKARSGAGLFTISPIAPSSECAHMKMTLRSNRGSPMPGIAIRSLAVRSTKPSSVRRRLTDNSASGRGESCVFTRRRDIAAM